MVVDAPIREPAPAHSALEPDSRGSGDIPPQESAAAGPTVDEPAATGPVELLIEEARNRARRRRAAIGAVAAATLAVAAMAVSASRVDGPPQGQGATLVAPAGTAPFGVFEPIRGRIAYVVGRELRAVDPADPSSVQTVALPDDLVGSFLMVSGWSADGTRLALTSEHSGSSYVMDADGAVTRAPSGEGCCWFVTHPWLSPDGTAAIQLIGDEGDRLRLDDLEGLRPSRIVELDPPVGDRDTGRVPVAAWSPDGARIAYVAHGKVGPDLLPSVHVVDLATERTRQLVGHGFGHIRQMAWSPDGSRLLVIAGPWRPTNPGPTSLNPMTSPKETGLYLISADGVMPAQSASALQPITSGHFLAATWSPDGAQIAAVEYGQWGRRMVVMNADGSASRDLVRLSTGDLFTGLAWHPGPKGR